MYYLSSILLSLFVLIMTITITLKNLELPVWGFVGVLELFIFLGVSVTTLALGLIGDIRKEKELYENH